MLRDMNDIFFLLNRSLNFQSYFQVLTHIPFID